MKKAHKIISLAPVLMLLFGCVSVLPVSAAENVPAVESRCIIGDTDSNDTININDVTALQKHLAQSAVPNGFNLDAADVDLNKSVNINDATMIQYYLAGIFNNTSKCGEVLKGGRVYYNMQLDFTDRLGWGRVSVYAFDEDKNMLPGAYVEDGDWDGSYDLMIPGDTDSIVVVSEDYTMSTTLCTDLGNGFGTHYVAWDKSNEEYVLCFRGWGGLAPQFYFINSLGWKHVTLVSYDRFGNVEDYDELSSDGNNRYFASVSAFASKVYIVGDNGEKTDLITGYYCVPGQEDVYYLDSSKTTVNKEGETVYVPILSTSTTEEEFPEDTVTFKFTNSLNWTDLYVYAWDDNGNDCCGMWRGKPLVSTEQDDFGTDVYVITLPAKAVGAIISGNEGQTTDITDFSPSGGGYYLTGQDTVPDSVTGQTTYIPVEWGEIE